MEIIHINQRNILYKNVKQKACLIQSIDEYNELEEKLIKKGFQYKRYEKDIDFFKVSLNNMRCIRVIEEIEMIEVINKSDTIPGELIETEIIEIPFLNHIEKIERPIYEEIKNDKFYLLLVHVINENTFDFDTINFYDDEFRLEMSNYELYPSEELCDYL